MAISPDTRNIFYVYMHRRASDKSVFYVGKGKGKRAYSLLNRNIHWRHIVDKHGFEVEMYRSDLYQYCALSIERALIAAIGRGSLCNLTDGGDGNIGYKHTDETKLKMSNAMRKRMESSEWRAKLEKIHSDNRLRVVRPETKERLSKALGDYAKSRPQSHNKAISDAKRGRSMSADATVAFNARKKRRPVLCSNGVRFESIKAAARWLRDNGWPKASDVPIIRCCKPEWVQCKTAYGFKWEYAEAVWPE